MNSKKILIFSLGALASIGLQSCGDTTNSAPAPPIGNNGIDPLTIAVANGPIAKAAPSTPPVVDNKKYPAATLSATPGVVVSPYKPYNLVGVSKYKSGDKARDPYTKQIFLVP